MRCVCLVRRQKPKTALIRAYAYLWLLLSCSGRLGKCFCEEDPKTEILRFLFTGESEYIKFVGKYNISLHDEFSQELENKLINEFYILNQKEFCEDLENFTDYFLSEHTILLKTYIYDILDNITPQKLKEIIF